jgi:hypothetical protein
LEPLEERTEMVRPTTDNLKRVEIGSALQQYYIVAASSSIASNNESGLYHSNTA